jgi:tellurite resistance protein TehA-like permease
VKPDAFAIVMATGIVSIAAADHGYRWITDVLAVIAVAGLMLLVAAAVIEWRRRPLDVADPDVVLRLFTFVAACAVLDTRLAKIPGALWMLGGVAMAAWLVLAVLAARNMSARRWSELQAQSHGAWELASVGTSGLAIVLTTLVRHAGSQVLLPLAVAMWLLAIAIYCLMTALILGRAFAERLDPNGFEPDGWILMGGLAIATLAGTVIHGEVTGSLADGVRIVTLVTWSAATLWIPPLIYFGIRHIQRPEALRVTGVWWAMVFPLGMYSAATYAMAIETGWSALRTVSLVYLWIASAAWLLVALLALLGFRRAQSR